MKALGGGGWKGWYSQATEELFFMTHFLHILRCESTGLCLGLHSFTQSFIHSFNYSVIKNIECQALF